jgi:HEAT repeat protein
MPLSTELFQQIVDFLQPLLPHVSERQALIYMAFSNSHLTHLINWEGSSYNFTVHLVRMLDQWGPINGVLALESVLTASHQLGGTEHQAKIQQLLKQLRTNQELWQGLPFPGLDPFQEDQEPIFFGREPEISRLLESIHAHPLVVVIGASGSGKSSLIQAGVIPRLTKDPHAYWQVIRFKPDEAGVGHPFASLRFALDYIHPIPKRYSADAFAANPDLLRDWCEKWLPIDHRLMILVDQFEETFTTIQESLRSPFIQALCKTLELPAIRLVLTMRSDFYEHCVNSADLAERMRTFPLAVPRLWALHQMVARPAALAGLTISESLIDTILADTGSEPGNLALLAYTLNKLTHGLPDRTLKETDYKAIGGVQGAIGKHAEEIFDKLEMDRKEELLAHVFRDLVEVDERGAATRKRARHSEFSNAEKNLIDELVASRLLTIHDDWLEVAHEALFRRWERLADWIAKAQEDLILLRQMRTAAYNWDRRGRLEWLLWSQENLNEVYEMQARLHPSLTDVEQAFLSNPEFERLFREFQSATSHRQLAIVDRWGKIGVSAVDSLVLALKTNITSDLKIEITEVEKAIAKELEPYVALAVPSIVDLLTSPEVYVRRQSADVLGELGDARAIPGLIKVFDDDNADVRHRVSRALVKIGVQSVPGLIEALKDDNAGVRRQAINTLIELKEQSVPSLVMALKDENVTIRCRIVGMLGQIGDKQAVPWLIIALKDKSSSVRQKAAEALFRLGRYALPKLSLTLKDENRYARQLSVEILGRVGDPQVLPDIVAVLSDKDKAVRQKAAQALVRLGSQTVSELITALTHEDRAVRLIVVKALGQATEKKGVPGLIMALNDDDADIRRLVITMLGDLGAHEAIPGLIATLVDESLRVRKATIRALEQLKAREALPSLIMLLKDEDSYVRQSVVQVLGRLKAKEAIPDLITALRDNVPNVREQAAEVLGQLGDKKAIPELILALKDTDIRVRWAAINALKRLGDKQAVPYLIEMLNDKDPILQATAFSLVQIGDERGLQALRDRPLIVDKLIRFLQVWKGLPRKQILQTLEAIGNPEAMQAVHQWKAQHSGKWDGFLLAL